jgi:hypothetical protein
MSTERLIWQGQKQEKIQAAKKLELSITTLRQDIRTILNPFAPLSDIDQEMLTNQAFELSDKLIQYKQLCREIAAINDSLGTN